MNHYPRHIGDYLKDTIGLTLAQEGVYNRALDLYYSQEHMLPKGQELRLALRCHSAGDRATLELILARYFEERPEGYWHKRCEAELAAQRERTDKASRGGRVRWAGNTAKHASSISQASFEHSPELMLGTVLDDPSQAFDEHELGACEPLAGSRKPVTKEVQKPGRHPKKNGADPLGSRLALDWQLPDDWRSWAIAYRPDLQPEAIDREALVFRDHWYAKAGKDARKADWLATWRNWMRRKD